MSELEQNNSKLNEEQLQIQEEVTQEQTTSLSDIQEPIQSEPASPQFTHHYAGFWMRFWAYLLDGIIIFAVNGILIKPIFRALGVSLSDSGFITPYGIAAGIVFYLYFILLTKFCGQTLGKMIFGLKVIPLKDDKLSWGTIIFREGVGRYISATFQFLYAVVAFTPKKQGLHDIFADTTVIHEKTKLVEPVYS